MTYEEALKIIGTRLRFGAKPGLERMTALLEAVGNPQKDLEFIHVAGTNGKGTACILMASALQAAGIKTGLYTSPYVLDFRERFQIDGALIPKQELADMVARLQPALQMLEAQGQLLTQFELITALAFLWFRKRGCQIVVLEVGLGGRFDATNVIDVPKAAVIMSISLDHTAVLGTTAEEIAFEKAGIIKPGGTVILYPAQAHGVRAVIEKACAERGAKLIIPEMETVEIKKASMDGTEFQVNGTVLATPFSGKHQVLNALTAYTVLRELAEKTVDITAGEICAGFQNARIPARMEVLSKHPLVLLDGGHNPGCALAMKNLLQDFEPDKRKIAVIGMMKDKDADATLSILAPLFDKIITAAPGMSRALSAKKLAEQAAQYCTDVQAADTAEAAAKEALALLNEETMLVICGSFFLAGEIRGIILRDLEKNYNG